MPGVIKIILHHSTKKYLIIIALRNENTFRVNLRQTKKSDVYLPNVINSAFKDNKISIIMGNKSIKVQYK